MENCLSLLLPRPEDFFIEGDSGQRASAEEEKKSDEQNPSKGMNEESDVSDNDYEESSVSSNPIFDFRKYGIINPHFSITLKVAPGMLNNNFTLQLHLLPLTSALHCNISCVVDHEPLLKKTEENAPIFENAQDLFKVVTNRHYPSVLKWETVLEKCSGENRVSRARLL